MLLLVSLDQMIGAEPPVTRLAFGQRIDELGVEAAGRFAWVDQPQARAPGSNIEPVGPAASLTAMARYLNDRAASIYGGSNEIQRDIMARLVLGL